MKMLIELHLDGCDTEQEHKKSCVEFVEEQLDFAASSVKILWVEKVEGE
jgi:hypothetical protein